VLRRLRIPAAFWAALAFALHPVCVVSVTWLAERKNTLSMCFYLLSLLWYLRCDDTAKAPAAPPGSPAAPRHTGRLYALSLAAFLLALLSKPSVVVLPPVLWLCLWWRQGRLGRRDYARLFPFAALAAVFCLVTLLVQHQSGRLEELPHESLLVRGLGAARAIWFYLGNALLPVNLTMHYPRWDIDPASPLA
jgi:protein O-mannosyl-transferase